MTKAQIKAANTIINDKSILGKKPGLFRDELGNIIVTNGVIAAVVNDFPTDTANTAPNGWKGLRETMDRNDSTMDTTLTLEMLSGKPRIVRVNGLPFLTKTLRRVVNLCGGQCTICYIGGKPQKFYGKDGIVGMVCPVRYYEEVEEIPCNTL